jgi:hypothetical protein
MPQSPAQLPFDLDDIVDPSLITARAGVPLAIELFRQPGMAATIDAQVAVMQRQRGLRPSQPGDSLVALWVAGGDRCQDLAAPPRRPGLGCAARLPPARSHYGLGLPRGVPRGRPPALAGGPEGGDP